MNESGEKRKVVLGVTGSIAAYKAVELARLLVSWGYEVRAVLTKSAQEFIAPTTFQAVTGNPVVTTFWDDSEVSSAGGIGHIELADWADVVVVAPATADCLARFAHGFADSPLSAVVLATKAPVLVAPAMNVNMWQHQATQKNLETLRSHGVEVVEPEEGALACGWNGAGRLADPQEIFYFVRRALSHQDFKGKRVIITTGPTIEPIDPVRFISNRSSGKMGVELAREAFRRGAAVTLIHGPTKIAVPNHVQCIPVETTAEMLKRVTEQVFPKQGAGPDVVIMAAAIADYRPKEVATQKLKKSSGLESISLAQNPDILGELGKLRGDKSTPVLVGFAVETGEVDQLIAEARKKLKSKKADMIVGNFALESFDLDTNRVWLVDRHGRQDEVSTSYKSRIADKVLDALLKI